MRMTKLRLVILEREESQYMVAAKCGFSPSRMSEYCLGKRAIPAMHVVKLCEYFGVQPEDITGWTEEFEDVSNGTTVSGREWSTSA